MTASFYIVLIITYSEIYIRYICHMAFPVAKTVKNLPAMQETWVRSLGWENPLEEGMATHSSILPWRIPWREGPFGLQSMGLQSWTQPSNQAQHVYAMYYNSAGIFLILIFLCPYGNSDNYDVAIIPILHVSKLSLRNTVPIILGSSFYVLNPAWDSG